MRRAEAILHAWIMMSISMRWPLMSPELQPIVSSTAQRKAQGVPRLDHEDILISHRLFNLDTGGTAAHERVRLQAHMRTHLVSRFENLPTLTLPASMPRRSLMRFENCHPVA
jgi:hypothetical protein